MIALSFKQDYLSWFYYKILQLSKHIISVKTQHNDIPTSLTNFSRDAYIFLITQFLIFDSESHRIAFHFTLL